MEAAEEEKEEEEKALVVTVRSVQRVLGGLRWRRLGKRTMRWP